MEPTPTNSTEDTRARTTKRRLSGTVVSTRMKDTVVVAVSRYVKHPKYAKYIKRVKRYKAHDPGNTHAEGDAVRIEECAPISKEKRFKVLTDALASGGRAS